MDLKSSIPVIANWPRPGVNFLDIGGILREPGALRQCVDHAVHSIRQQQATSVIAVESRGFLFASAACAATGTPLYLARKPGRLPGACYSITYATEYSEDSIELQTSIDPGPRPLIIDDLLATGGTIMALAQLIQQHWSPARVAACVIITLDFLPGRAMLAANHIDLSCLVSYDR